MSKLRCHISISLDGFVAGPNQSEENPLGEGGERLHDWVVPLAAWRQAHGKQGGEVNESTRVLEESVQFRPVQAEHEAGLGAKLPAAKRERCRETLRDLFGALVQVNDPDPALWLLVYVAAAVVTFLANRRPADFVAPAIVGLVNSRGAILPVLEAGHRQFGENGEPPQRPMAQHPNMIDVAAQLGANRLIIQTLEELQHEDNLLAFIRQLFDSLNQDL